MSWSSGVDARIAVEFLPRRCPFRGAHEPAGKAWFVRDDLGNAP